MQLVRRGASPFAQRFARQGLRRVSTAIEWSPIGGDIGLETDVRGGDPLALDVDWVERLATGGAIGLRGVGWTSKDQLVEFARHFGTITQLMQTDRSAADLTQLYVSQGRKPVLPSQPPPSKRGTDFWHSDSSFNARPSRATILYALSCGDSETSTNLCDSARAYSTLSEDLRWRAEGLLAEHDSTHEAGTQTKTRRSRLSRVRTVHPVVRSHPISGRPWLFVNPLYTRRLLQPDHTPLQNGDSLLAALFEHMLMKDNCASFWWMRPGDVLVMDNASMMHQATTIQLEEGRSRRMLRLSVNGQRPQAYHREYQAWHTSDCGF